MALPAFARAPGAGDHGLARGYEWGRGRLRRKHRGPWPSGLVRGYAEASTDTGHKGTPADGSWALNNSERRGVQEATDPDLSLFKANGGKLLIWNGWADPVVTPVRVVRYFLDVVDTLGEDTLQFS